MDWHEGLIGWTTLNNNVITDLVATNVFSLVSPHYRDDAAVAACSHGWCAAHRCRCCTARLGALTVNIDRRLVFITFY